MKRQLQDEQLDTLMRTLVSDASADDATTADIADSPTLWWGVQRQINAGKDANRSPWPPISKIWRLLLVGVPVAVAAALVIGFIVFRPAGETPQVAVVQTPVSQPDLPPSQTEVSKPSVPVVEQKQPRVTAVKLSTHAVKDSVTHPASNTTRHNPTTTATVKKTEIKTEFIALSYARNPESGQIVRVRVPSSMMVTLGLVSTVEKPSALIDAEVIVGDDGLTRAIRFIH